jgi:hypothetical protein
MIHHEELAAIELEISERTRIIREQEEKRELGRERAAFCIQSYLRRFNKRMFFYYLWRIRVNRDSAVTIQRVARGIEGRNRAKLRLEEKLRFLALAPFALKLQRTIRGHLCRLFNPSIAKVLREMYIGREAEAQAAIGKQMFACIYVCMYVSMYV